MIETLENIDHNIFLYFNGLHADWLDPIMMFISSKIIWLPAALLFIYFIIKKYKKQFWIPLVFTILCFVVTDQGSHLTKESVKRYRPTHNVELANQTHVVDDYRGGQYGFFSGHAANSFGLALISLLFVRKRLYSYIIITWAILVSYSRIYLGVHYPSDIFVGMAFGCSVAYILWKSHKLIPFSKGISLEK